MSDTITVTINVSNVDENVAPVFTEGISATRSIAENTAADVAIGTPVAATDADETDELTYTLGGTDAASFSIDSTTGQLKTKIALNYEQRDTYTVVVTVSDGRGGTDTITVTINIANVVNEGVQTQMSSNNAPVFTDGASTQRSVDENVLPGNDIGDAISATDTDDDSLTYTLSGTDVASFNIVSTTGQIQTKAILHFETKNIYRVTVTVSDGRGGSDTISVTIFVGYVDGYVPNINFPSFTDGESTTRSIAENTAADVAIGTPVAATDADETDELTYTLGGTDAASFSIDSTTGQLKTKIALNYEQRDTYTVVVTVSDGRGGTDTITVTINITNVVNEGCKPK